MVLVSLFYVTFTLSILISCGYYFLYFLCFHIQKQLILHALAINLSVLIEFALGNIKHASYDRWSSGNKDHNFYNREKGIKPVVDNMPQPRWKGQFCKKSKLDKFSNFAVQSKHAIQGESQSQSCFESKVEGGFRPIDLSFFIEQLRRGCSTCKSNISLLDIQRETKLGLASIIALAENCSPRDARENMRVGCI